MKTPVCGPSDNILTKSIYLSARLLTVPLPRNAIDFLEKFCAFQNLFTIEMGQQIMEGLKLQPWDSDHEYSVIA